MISESQKRKEREKMKIKIKETRNGEEFHPESESLSVLFDILSVKFTREVGK